jgi:hypothetical protein
MDELGLFHIESEESHSLLTIHAEVLSAELLESMESEIHAGLLEHPYFVFYAVHTLFVEESVWPRLQELIELVHSAGGDVVFINFRFPARFKATFMHIQEAEDLEEAIDHLLFLQFDDDIENT